MGMVYGGESIFKIEITTFIPYFIIFLTIGGIALIHFNKNQSNMIRQITEIHTVIFGIFLLIEFFLIDGSANFIYNIAFTGYSLFLITLLLK